MKRPTTLLFLAVTAASLIISRQAPALVTHDVSTAGDLQTALLQARSNGDDDVINLAAGTYKVSQNGGNPFRYITTEDFSLTIIGAGADQTFLDGETTDQVMNLDTTTVPDLGADITVQGITFEQGDISGAGGGLAVTTLDANISVADCVFTKNQTMTTGASDIFDGGGAGAFLFANGSGDISVSNSTFSENNAAAAGGGFFGALFNGDARIEDSVFSGNHATGSGGGSILFVAGGSIDFLDNIVRENVISGTGVGGGIGVLAKVAANVVNNTFYDNFAPEGGGAAAVQATKVNLYNNLFDANTAGKANDIFIDDTSPTTILLFNNLLSEFCVGSGSCAISDLGADQGGNLVGVDPLLADPTNGDFHLLAGSPAINAGSPDAPSLPALDFEGDPRVLGSAPDIGADEADACGNGTVETGEECDDGNTANGDGCSAACLTETTPPTGGNGGCSLIRRAP